MGAVALTCDVTKPPDVKNLATNVGFLVKGRKRLWCVINNAGVGDSGRMDWVDNKTLRWCMEVNYFGLVDVTQALLPLLKLCRHSRIINVSSMAGTLGSPNMGPYCGEYKY
ncbi:hypothetical protein B484DRAFT_171417 [Ochromonadaceae sp. CCMP2298]|nr:hypothetical protein B484DRAFT_171417 [Ochromonadaceae sp. CCMP2298]